MKRLFSPWFILLVLPALFPLWGCTSSTDCSEYESEVLTLKDTITYLQTGIETSESERQNLESTLAAIEAERDALQKEYAEAAAQLQDLQTTYENLLKDIQTPRLKNPTWSELKRFIEEDRTDALQYIPGKFDCEGFAIKFRDAAGQRGFRCAFVAVGFGENAVGHALNAFQTDQGTIYIDVTERDSIAYIEKGKPYGTIVLEGVRETYIDCAYTTPDAFWKKPLRYTRYGGNLFAYKYYQNYSARWAFYDSSVSAYNAEVQRYNAAVRAFNQGTGTYSYVQLQEWSDRLEAWAENLSALETDLGTIRIEPLGTVDTIEVYWN